MIALILAAAVFAAVAIPYARRLDYAEFHVMHEPDSGCVECGDK